MPNRARWILLTLSVVWCAGLIVRRVPFAGRVEYGFLVWNLFLAALPLIFSEIMERSDSRKIRWTLFPAWLLFFPNAPYVLTGLLHLKPRHGVPLWFDLLLLISCAAAALIMGFISLRQRQNIVSKAGGAIAGWIFVLATLFAAGFGIYLGRFLRWNSWDLLLNPAGLAWDVIRHVGDPFTHPATYGVTIGFGVLLSLCCALFAGLQRRQTQ